jgi:pyrophosphatase PpaX
MDVLVSCDDVARPKPDPEPVHRALEWLGVGADDVVFVGDSLHDLHCGHAAGVRTAAALWGPFTRDDLAAGDPDFWLEAPADLLGVIDRAAKEKGPGPFCI